MSISYRFLQNQLRTEPHFFEIIQLMGVEVLDSGISKPFSSL